MNLDRLNEVKAKAKEKNVPILMDESLALIEVLLEMEKPSKILEIGTAVGYSAMCFSKHLTSGGKVDTIEINEEMVKTAKENIEYVGIDSNVINIIHADATQYLKEINNDNEYDVIFIDAAKGQYIVFLEEAIRLVKPR